MLHLRILYLSAPLAGSKLEFMMKLIWKHKFSMIDKLFLSINFVMRFLSGNKKANKWFLIFLKKDLKYLYNNFNQNKKNVLKAVTLLVVKPQRNFMVKIKINWHDKVLFLKLKNNLMVLITLKTIQRNIFKSLKRNKNWWKNNWHKQSIKLKTNMNMVCC